MKVFLMVLAILWVAGWLRMLARVNAAADKLGLKYQSEQAKAIAPIVMFFTWPYFYFYEKA